jgi:radical SAM protein with 4Fe4S-binding SPASM domain
MDEAVGLGIKNIRFTGGEPLLHPQLQDMLSYSRAKRFYTLLNTNATLLTALSIRSLSRTVDNALVSLQGFNETSDQKLTLSSLPFKHKINNILLLRKNIPTVRVGTVITRVLIENLPSYARMIKALGVDSWELFRPLTGSQDKLAHISRVEYRQLALQILRLKTSGLNVKLANAIPFCLLPDPHASASIMLGAESDDGNSRLVWDCRGFFKPSYFITRDLGQKIKDAWASPFLRKLQSPSYLPQECRHCDFLSWCKGGSRSAAHKAYGTYFTADPLFQHRPRKNLHLA